MITLEHVYLQILKKIKHGNKMAQEQYDVKKVHSMRKTYLMQLALQTKAN